MSVVDKAFEDLPPVARHALTLVIFGAALATCYFTFDARVSAAEQVAEQAKSSAALMIKRIDDLSARTEIRANLVEARVIKGNIIAMWTRFCDAEHAENKLAATVLASVIRDLRDEYRSLTNGGDFQPGTCP